MKRLLNKTVLTLLLVLIFIYGFSQSSFVYKSLDPSQPVLFEGDHLIFRNEKIALGPHSFFVDGRIPDSIARRYPYVFNSINKAAEKLTPGTEADPMVLHIAPYVYWIDDPDDAAIRVGENGLPPYGLVIDCPWLRFQGLSDDPAKVVLACNRGQTIGARGNFTMFRFLGDGISAENITFGNYCNIDLDYPLLPKLGRARRASAIVQAQLIHCNGDKILARNCRFLSRLNLCPFTGAKRALFDNCHFESTDDALCGTAVYLHCSLDFYSSKPFYRTTGTGAVFLDCDIRSLVEGEQYFTKANGQLTLIDTRITTPEKTYIGWRDAVPEETRNYQFGVLQNGQNLLINRDQPVNTVQLDHLRALDAYRITDRDQTIYNTYNLLRGNDDWDPAQVKTKVREAEKRQGKALVNLPVQLQITPSRKSIETSKSQVELSAQLLRYGNYEGPDETIHWQVMPGYDSLVKLEVGGNGKTCKVIPVSRFDDTREVIIIAKTVSGLEAASVLTVSPSILASPGFSKKPKLEKPKDGQLLLHYSLDTRYKDQSLISWYRCRNAQGDQPVEILVSRFGQPQNSYELQRADLGHYIMAVIRPKHSRSEAGEAFTIVSRSAVQSKDLTDGRYHLETDFLNLSVRNQPQILPGAFTWQHLAAVQTGAAFATDTSTDAWFIGNGIDGAAGMTGLIQGRNAEMLYTPVAGHGQNMKLVLRLAPFKTAGQGFSVAPLYMDVLIKLDTKTRSGWGVRFIRTTKYHNAVDACLIKYVNGEVILLTEPVTTTAFRSICVLRLEYRDGELSAELQTNAGPHDLDDRKDIAAALKLAARVEENNRGGFGIEFRGGSPVMISQLHADWEKRSTGPGSETLLPDNE